MPGVNSNVNHRLQVIMMNECRFIDCDKCTTALGQDDDGSRGWAHVGAVSTWILFCTVNSLLLQTYYCLKITLY